METPVEETPAGGNVIVGHEASVDNEAPPGGDTAAVENIPAGGEVAVAEDPQIGVADPVGNSPAVGENVDGSPPTGLAAPIPRKPKFVTSAEAPKM